MFDSILYSLGLLFIFIGKLLKCMFPVLWVLVPFAWFSRKSIRKLNALKFFIIFMTLDLVFRLILFYGGIPFQRRYFFPLTICAIVFSGPGFLKLNKLLAKYAVVYAEKNEKFSWLTSKNITFLLLAVVVISCVGKAMRTKFDKKWIRQIPRIIQKHCPDNQRPILVSALEEPRMGYYAEGDFLKILPMKDFLKESNITITRADGSVVRKPVGDLLNDDRPETGIKLHKGDSIDIELKSDYPARKAYMYLDWQPPPTEKIDIHVDVQKADKSKQSLYHGNGEKQARLANTKHANHLKILINGECRLNDMDLTRFEKWKILRQGEGYNSDRWFFLKYPGGIENLADNIAKLGGRKVFILIKADKEEFERLFHRKNLSVPFIFLGEFKIRKKGIFSLYQGKDSNVKTPRPESSDEQ